MVISYILEKIPVVTEDPFLQYRPFPEVPKTLFQKHWHEIFASFTFYFIIQQLSGPIFSIIMGPRYTKLSKSTRVNFDVHVTSMVQCFVSFALMVPHLNNPHWVNRLNDPANSLLGSTDFGGLVCALTVGYFIWDLYVCAKYFSLFGVGFLFHGFAAMYAFATGFVPYCQPWAGPFLTFELSTPFVNINWFASKLPAGTFSEKTIIINGILLMVTFFIVRIVWGFYAVSQLAVDMLASLDQVNKLLPISLLVLNFLLNSLNVFWFYKMVMIARKKARGQESTREAAKEVREKIE